MSKPGRRLKDFLWTELAGVVTGDVWRRGMKVRIAILAALITFSVAAWLALEREATIGTHTYGLMLCLYVPAHLLNISMNLWTLRVARAPSTYRKVAFAALGLELWAITISMWLNGGVSTSLNALWFVVLIAAYRIGLGARLGFVAFVGSIAGTATAAALELGGVVDTAILWGDAPQHVGPLQAFGNVGAYTVMYASAWLICSVVAHRNAELYSARREISRLLGKADTARLADTVLAGEYALHRLLGRGGMGEVYVGTRKSDGQEVAVKVLHPCYAGDVAALERFRREADVGGRVPAGHVPEVYDVGITADNEPFIVMEYLRGEDLEGVLQRRNELPAGEVVELVDAIARCLDAIHCAGAVHRDLKPSNVFLVEASGAAPEVRLLDLGIAKLQDETVALTRTQVILGTPGFMAPEQIRSDEGPIGPESDVFALGALAYLALSGERPFPGREPAEYVYEVLYRRPDLLAGKVEGLHQDVDLALAVALAERPKQRYATALELARDLRAAVAGKLGEASRVRGRSLLGRPRGQTSLDPTLADAAGARRERQ